jgi:phage-related protein
MTTGWLIVNIALIAVVAALVTSVSVLVPHRLHRRAIKHDARDAASFAAGRHDADDERLAA